MDTEGTYFEGKLLFLFSLYDILIGDIDIIHLPQKAPRKKITSPIMPMKLERNAVDELAECELRGPCVFDIPNIDKNRQLGRYLT